MPPGRLPPSARALWFDLLAPTVSPQPFDPGMLADLPEPARRWLTHAVAPGTPMYGRAVLTQRGTIKIGRWRRYQATWLLAPPHGFLWVATTRLGPLPIRGFDRYGATVGEMRWRLAGALPIAGAHGVDVTRSAAGRLAAELFFVPAVTLGPHVRWEEFDRDRATAHVRIGATTHQATITVSEDGPLQRIDMPRWGNPDRGPFREHVFTALLDTEQITADGYTIPAGARAGWWHCPDHCAREEFIRFTVTDAAYR